MPFREKEIERSEKIKDLEFARSKLYEAARQITEAIRLIEDEGVPHDDEEVGVKLASALGWTACAMKTLMEGKA